jgi:hypothetical protein
LPPAPTVTVIDVPAVTEYAVLVRTPPPPPPPPISMPPPPPPATTSTSTVPLNWGTNDPDPVNIQIVSLGIGMLDPATTAITLSPVIQNLSQSSLIFLRSIYNVCYLVVLE